MQLRSFDISVNTFEHFSFLPIRSFSLDLINFQPGCFEKSSNPETNLTNRHETLQESQICIKIMYFRNFVSIPIPLKKPILIVKIPYFLRFYNVTL